MWKPHFKQFTRNFITQGGKQKVTLRKSGVREISEFVYELKDYRYFNKNLHNKMARRIKSAVAYRLRRSNGCIYKQWKRLPLSMYVKYLNINSPNRLVGFTPDYVGFRPSKPVGDINYFAKFFKERKIMDKLSHNFKNQAIKSLCNYRVVYSGSFDSCTNHLIRMFSGDKSKITTEEIFRRIGKDFRWFLTSDLKTDDPLEMLAITKINEKSSTGHYTSKFVANSKGEAFKTSFAVALDLFELIKVKPIKNYYLWDVLAREKDIKLNDDDDDVSVRSILNTEAPASLLLTWFAQKLSYIMNQSRTSKWNITGKFDAVKFNKYYNLRTKYDYYLEADWSQFDANVDSQFIMAAACILLSGIEKNDVNQRICYYIYKSIVTKYVCVPPGLVVELNRSIPSGHPFTTLMNCTINVIYWSLIGYEIYGESYLDNMDLYIYGDDANVFFKDHPRLHLIDDIVEDLGLSSEPLVEKIKPTFGSDDIHDSHDFLKRRFSHNEIVYNRTKMLDRLFYPTKARDIHDQIDLAYQFLITAPHDNEYREICISYFNYLKEEYNDKLDHFDEVKINKIIDDEYFETYRKEYSDSNIPFLRSTLTKSLFLSNYQEEHYFADRRILNRVRDVMFSTSYNLIKALALPYDLANKYKHIFNETSTFNMNCIGPDRGSFKINWDPRIYLIRNLDTLFTGDVVVSDSWLYTTGINKNTK